MDTGEVYVCGGGAYNSHLLEQLRWRLRKHNWSVQTTSAIGLAPTWVEATAFALVGHALYPATQWQLTDSDRHKVTVFSERLPRFKHQSASDLLVATRANQKASQVNN